MTQGLNYRKPWVSRALLFHKTKDYGHVIVLRQQFYATALLIFNVFPSRFNFNPSETNN